MPTGYKGYYDSSTAVYQLQPGIKSFAIQGEFRIINCFHVPKMFICIGSGLNKTTTMGSVPKWI
jgi:hypothetical protein